MPAVPKLTEEQKARIEVLVKAGLTTTWIADDLGVPREQVKNYLMNRPDNQANAKAFNEVWPTIRPNVELRRLHNEIAPKKAAK